MKKQQTFFKKEIEIAGGQKDKTGGGRKSVTAGNKESNDGNDVGKRVNLEITEFCV